MQIKLNLMKPKPGLEAYRPSGQEMEWACSTEPRPTQGHWLYSI